MTDLVGTGTAPVSLSLRMANLDTGEVMTALGVGEALGATLDGEGVPGAARVLGSRPGRRLMRGVMGSLCGTKTGGKG